MEPFRTGKLIVLALATYATTAQAATLTPGCFPAVIFDVLDGDTVAAIYGTSDPLIWGKASIRLYGIDTPEKARSKLPGKIYPAKCHAEASKGKEASAFLNRKLEPYIGVKGDPKHSKVRICAAGSDKYYGRLVALLQFRTSEGWTDVSRMMLGAGLAFPYDGGKKASWCDCLDKGECPKGYRGK